MKKSVAVVVLGLLGGCAPLIEVNGFTVKQPDYEKASTAVKNRASFELQCPREQLQVVVLNVFSWNTRYVQQIGISGCEKRAVYVREAFSDTWVMNTESQPK